jgi:Family of unknown function (DUF6065)
VTHDPVAVAPPELVCYPLEPDPPAIEPARAVRDWMDLTDQRYAYRCLPLSIANASGWEILCPVAFEATWRGSDARDAITIRSREDETRARRLASSHFGHGILTLHTGYLFRTSPGWALWARGAPNTAKRNLAPLEGVVETDWLDFPFTMNWRFTRAGTVAFEKGEPFCFITLVAHAVIDTIEPKIRSLDADPALKAAYEARAKGRADFNAGLAAHDPEAVAQGWQRHYMRGEDATGRQAGFHLTKRRVKPFKPETER